MWSRSNLLVAIVWTDIALLCNNTDFDRPHREVAFFWDGVWWTAEAVPDCASKALARTGHRIGDDSSAG